MATHQSGTADGIHFHVAPQVLQQHMLGYYHKYPFYHVDEHCLQFHSKGSPVDHIHETMAKRVYLAPCPECIHDQLCEHEELDHVSAQDRQAFEASRGREWPVGRPGNQGKANETK